MPVQIPYSKGKPVTATQVVGQAPNLPQTRRIPAFLVVANPASWEYDQKDDKWRPVVKCLPVRAGCNGATSNGTRVIDAGFRANIATDGWVDLTHEPRLTARFGPLVCRHEQQDGGNHYGPPWQELGVVGGKTRKRYDMALFREFQDAVVDVIGPMAGEVLEDTTARLKSRLGQYRMDRTGGANIARMASELEASLEAMEKAWDRQFGTPAPEPAKRARKAVADG